MGKKNPANAALEDAAKTVTELKERAENGDKDALAAVEEIVTNFNAWKQAIESKKKVAGECKEQLEKEEAAFTSAVEESLPANATKEKIVGKLHLVEERWQELQDVRTLTAERKKEAAEEVKTWAEKLDRSIKDSAQLALRFPEQPAAG